ncbi:MAG: UDP-N-acetylmuramoyl-L-alanyl-D-glutamate--2,6-diaminopimelate ligase [Bacilli bacterium]|nr:UDP-N-acetylmuramoyl-L-alanyl-D-glutamate--2,6-diaminopimelate ligase [Bacilli bacterium]
MNIKVDSRKVKRGDTFVALRSTNDGHKYIEDAIAAGASLVVCEEGLYSVDTMIVNDTRDYLINYLKDNYYSQISKLKLIGITGTNGKTTSAFLIHQVLNKLDIKCAYIGTIGLYIGEKIRDLPNTTPDILDIYEILFECAEKEVEYVVMEVSSHALDMRRVDGLEYDYTLFTNLTQDHLNYHGTMDNYCNAKQKLFKMLKSGGKSIVNVDDDYSKHFISKDTITYGFNKSDYQLSDYEIINNITYFKVNNNEYHIKLLGKHNVYNMLNVIIVLKDIGFSDMIIKEAISELTPPPGRMDIIHHKSNLAIVDYAHTPDAVEKIINAVREFAQNNIITIVGCGGNRDKAKRPIMAKIATDLSDYVIFTSDNPRLEEPDEIINDMVDGLDNLNYEIESNREKAIKKGIQKLNNSDILLVLGKGHETYQIIGDKKIDFDDKKIIIDNL